MAESIESGAGSPPAWVSASHHQIMAMAGSGVGIATIAAAIGVPEAELAAHFGQAIGAERAKMEALIGQSLVKRALKGEGRDATAAAQAWLRRAQVVGAGAIALPAAAATAQPSQGSEAALTCNFEEMADKLGVSKPTLGQWIRKWDDFPVLARGSNGVAWQFDPHAVVAFVGQKRAEEEAANAARADLLGQIALPFEQAPGATADLAEMGQLYKLARAADELGVTRGQLLRVADLREPMWALLTRWRQSCLHLPRRWGTRHNLPPAVVAEIRRDLEEWLTEIHAGSREILTAAAVPETPSDDEAAAAAA